MKPQPNIICTHCIHTWTTKSKHKFVTCPNCQKKTLGLSKLTREERIQYYVNLKRENDNGNQNLNTQELYALDDIHLSFKLQEQIRLKYMRENKISLLVF